MSFGILGRLPWLKPVTQERIRHQCVVIWEENPFSKRVESSRVSIGRTLGLTAVYTPLYVLWQWGPEALLIAILSKYENRWFLIQK